MIVYQILAWAPGIQLCQPEPAPTARRRVETAAGTYTDTRCHQHQCQYCGRIIVLRLFLKLANAIRARSYLKSDTPLADVGSHARRLYLEVEISVDPPQPGDRVVERPIQGRREVLLDVARIEMVEHVVYGQPCAKLDAMAVELEVNWILKFCVER